MTVATTQLQQINCKCLGINGAVHILVRRQNEKERREKTNPIYLSYVPNDELSIQINRTEFAQVEYWMVMVLWCCSRHLTFECLQFSDMDIVLWCSSNGGRLSRITALI